MTLTIMVAVVSSLTSGLGVAIFNHFLGRKKASLERETMQLELQRLRAELNYGVSSAVERVIYESRKSGTLGYDFTAIEGRHWSKGEHVGEKAGGKLRFLDGVIDVLRTNNHGKYELRL